MKKITKFLVVALTVALLIGAVVGVSSSAAETEGEKWVVSKNVSYDENTHLFFAIDASLAEDSSLLKVDVLDAAGTSLVGEELLTVSEESVDIYEDDSMIAHVVKTPGVAAKDMADVFTINVYYGETADETTLVETTTYSVAEYFLQRLYKDGVVDAAELAEGTDEEIAAAKKAVSQKKLYEASLRYGAAAQKVLTDDTVLVDDLIYITSPSITGVVSKGYTIQLDSANYKFDYYSDTNKGVDYDMTGAAGYYVIDESVKISAFATSVKGPKYAVDFEDMAIGDVTVANTHTILGAASTQAITKVVSATEKTANFFASVNEEGSKYFHSGLVAAGGSHAFETYRDTTQNDTYLVSQVRMRWNRSAGSIYHRMYTGRKSWDGTRVFNNSISASGTKVTYQSKSTGVSIGEWFTMRTVVTYSDSDSTATYTVYFGKDVSSLTEVYTATSTVASGLDVINNETFMYNTSFVGSLDVDYTFFGAVDNLADVTESGDKAEVTLAPDYLPYDSGVWTSDVIKSGASFTNNNSTYTSNFGYVKAEGENKYVSFTDTTTSGQAQLMFTNTNDLTDKDTLTFNVDLRFSDNPNGTNAYHNGDNSVQIRVRNASSSASANTGYLRIYADDNGKVKVSDYSGGVVATDIDASEWFTVSVSYTSNAAKCQVTITSGEKSANAEIAATSEAHQVAISAITNIGIYTSTGFMGIFDVDNVSIVAE